MVKKHVIFLLLIFSGTLGVMRAAGQNLHIGAGFNQAIPSYETSPKTHYLSYIQYGQSQDLQLELKSVSSIPLPVGWVSFEGKNRWLIGAGITTSRNVFQYDINKSVDLGIRLITLDVLTTVGYKINPFGLVTLIPEIGITNRSVLSARSGTTEGSGDFSTDYTINELPELTGVKAGYLTNQSMDFHKNITYAHAGLKLKWYNFYATVAYEAGLTDVDKRQQYTSVSQTYVAIGVDLLSTYFIKKQKPGL